MDRIFSEEQYSGFSETDFLADPFFQDWVIHARRESEIFWKQFLSHYPHKKEEVENARKLLIYLSFKEHIPSEDLVQQSLQKHLQEIEKLEEEKVISLYRPKKWSTALKVAAFAGGVILFLSALLLLNNIRDRKITALTDYGKLDSLFLPDSSKVVLNAHSKIRYSKDWTKDKQREVWLEGEAFFDVRHINEQKENIQPFERFLVHTEDLDIEVLGTSFNIRQRRGITEVVLQTGSIKVLFRKGERKEMILKPGELLAYNPDEEVIEQTTTNPHEYTAWKEKKLILHNPSVNEIVAYLEDNFGKKIILQTSGLGEKELSGPIPLSNLEDALFILSTVYNMEVIRRADEVIVLRSRD
jgi:ferric-dicitrate binding protein FerR (iron transport regulator)